MQEYLCRFAAPSICWRKAASTAASVKMKPSMVAMSGAIMPEPLMMPTRFTVLSQITAERAADLGKVSVVMIVARSEERRGGKECGRTCSTRRSQYHKKKKKKKT